MKDRKQFESAMWESACGKSNSFVKYYLPTALNVMRTIVTALKIAHPDDDIDLTRSIDGDHIYIDVNNKIIDIDILNGSFKEENANEYLTPYFRFC